MSATGFFAGVLGLAGLEVLVNSNRASSVVGGVGSVADQLVARIVSPDLGLIPNLHDSNASTSSTSTPPATSSTAPTVLPKPVPTKPVAKQGKTTDATAGQPPLMAPPLKGTS